MVRISLLWKETGLWWVGRQEVGNKDLNATLILVMHFCLYYYFFKFSSRSMSTVGLFAKKVPTLTKIKTPCPSTP